MRVRIKEKSLFAKIAAKKLNAKRVAAVLGNTIHLWNVSREDFLAKPSWVVHELEHINQFRRYGFIRFCFLYLAESARKGYDNNRFEVEARVAEMGEANLDGIEFI